MADEFDRAQEVEERERSISIAEQLRRGATTRSETCEECDVQLEEHRKEYGTCISCKTRIENHQKHHRRN